MNTYYLAATNQVLVSSAIKNRTGLDPEAIGIEALNQIGVYPIDDPRESYELIEEERDLKFHTAVRTYTINNGQANPTWDLTEIPIADARVLGAKYARQKAQKALELIAAMDDGYGPLVLLAAAAQHPSSRAAETQAKLEGVAEVLAAMLTNIADINAAADVPAIYAIIDDINRDSQALSAAQQKAMDGDDLSFGGAFTLSDSLTDAVDDAAAATAGVAVNQLYRNGSVVQIRVS